MPTFTSENLRTPFPWEWESVDCFYEKESKMSTFTSCDIMNNGSMHSSVSGTSSGSDLGNGSSLSSVSASVGSSTRDGIHVSEMNLESNEYFHKNLHENNESTWRDFTETSPAAVGSNGAEEPPIGLKLGKRTYFENFGATNMKASSSSAYATPTAAVIKTSRLSHQATQHAYCQVEGCNIDLIAAKDYHRRHRVCEFHSKSPKVTIAGQGRRFCQQCSRFHDLSWFDQKKRSCRKRLSDHNARRRKPQAETSFSFSGISSIFFGADEKQKMNLFQNEAPFSLSSSTSTMWEESSSRFSLSTTKWPWAKLTKADSGLAHLSVINFSNEFPTSSHGFDEINPLDCTMAEVLSQGLEASVSAPNSNGAPDLRLAHSLLSKYSCGLSKQNNMIQFATMNPAAALHLPVQASNSNGADCWEDEHSLALYESPFFEANQVFSKEFCNSAQFKAQNHPKITF